MNGKFVFNNMSKAGAINTFRKRYDTTYAINQQGIFKAFTTNYLATTGWVPRYEIAITGRQIGITSTDLNPFGSNTAGDGNAHGSSLNGFDDPTTCIEDAWNTRSVGLKTPMTHVGYGYDIFGYPSPNYSAAWDASGVMATGSPESLYAPFEIGGESSVLGSDTDPSTWKAGPLDLRWDQHRKVWTCNYGVYAAVIHKAYSGSTLITDFNTPLWGDHIRYDARIYDGLNSGILVTGVSNSIFKPTYNTYKVYPTPTGEPCLISHVPGGNRPRFGILSWEKPATVDCQSLSTSSSLLGTLSFDSLYADPLGVAYGGIGDNTTPAEGDILVANDASAYYPKHLLGSNNILVSSDATSVYVSHSGLTFTTTGTYNLSSYDQTLFCELSSTNQTVNLPNATIYNGQKITIKDCLGNFSSYPLRVNPYNTGQTIDGATGYIMSTNYDKLNIISNGNRWFII